jgi:hypothetical protein
MSRIDVHMLSIRAAADPRLEYRGPLEGRGPLVKNRWSWPNKRAR